MKASRIVCVVLLAIAMLAGLLYIADCLWIGSTVRRLARDVGAGGFEYTEEESAYITEDSFYAADLSCFYVSYDDNQLPDEPEMGMIVSSHCFAKGAAFFRCDGWLVTVWLEFREGRWWVTDIYES